MADDCGGYTADWTDPADYPVCTGDVCVFDGKTLQPGGTFVPAGDCNECVYTKGGRVLCTPRPCFQ